MRYCPYGLSRLTLTVLVAVAICGIGACGLGWIGGFAVRRAPNMRSKVTVFAAAPVSFKRKFFDTDTSLKLKAPPPYVNDTFSNLQPLQDRPSNCCVTPTQSDSVKLRLPSGGTLGISPGADTAEDCAKVDAWFPASTKNIMEAPTINDPNASVTLDITPPSEDSNGENCAVWVYHYGKPPSKQSDSIEPILISSPAKQ
jgi:hypothetical protein